MQPYQLKNLFDQGKYDEVIAFWSNPEEVAQFTEWDYNTCMNAFYKLKRYGDCLEVYRACKQCFPECTLLEDKMGWALYQTHIKGFDFARGDRGRLFEQIDYVFAHSSSTRYSSRCILAKFVMDAVNGGKLQTENGNELIAKYLDQIDPAQLDPEEKLITDQDGKQRAMASDQETWYSEKIKIYLKLQRYEDCKACCDEALRTVTRFHYNDDSWFRYRKAQCLQAQGETIKARKLVQEILQNGFSHWCLQELLFELARDEGKTDEALMHLGACALSDSEHKMRVNFYANAADYLEAQGLAAETVLHRRLVVILRQENEWKEKPNQAEWQFTDEIAAMGKEEILNRLKPFWKKIRDKNKEYRTGVIDNILPSGKSGFIKADSGESYFFSARDLIHTRQIPAVGTSVRYTLADRLDKSKGIVKKNAVEITVLKK